MKYLINVVKNNKTRLIAGLSLLMVNTMSWAAATDVLAGEKPTLQSNFGAGSTVQWILLLIEVIAGAGAYIKTKSLYSLLGIVILSLFINGTVLILGS